MNVYLRENFCVRRFLNSCFKITIDVSEPMKFVREGIRGIPICKSQVHSVNHKYLHKYRLDIMGRAFLVQVECECMPENSAPSR